MLPSALDHPPGTWHLAPGTWHLAPGTWHLAPGTWQLAPGTWHLAPGTWHLGENLGEFDQQLTARIGPSLHRLEGYLLEEILADTLLVGELLQRLPVCP